MPGCLVFLSCFVIIIPPLLPPTGIYPASYSQWECLYGRERGGCVFGGSGLSWGGDGGVYAVVFVVVAVERCVDGWGGMGVKV